MNEYLVSDLNGREFRFLGELILERESQVDLNDEFERTFAIKVYGVEHGVLIRINRKQQIASSKLLFFYNRPTDKTGSTGQPGSKTLGA